MDLFEAQREAVRMNAADSAEFDLVNRAGLRSHCKWEDADMGLFTVLDRPPHLKGRLLHVSIFEGDDGARVENLKRPPSPEEARREALTSAVADIWGVEDRRCDGNHPRGGCEWEKVLRTVDLLTAPAP